MKSKGSEGLPPLTCPSPSLPGSSSPDRRLDSCSRRFRVWEREREISEEGRLVPSHWPQPSKEKPWEPRVLLELPSDPVLSYLSLASQQGRGLALLLSSLARLFPLKHSLFPLAPAPGPHLSLTFTRQFSS